MKIRNGFVSNSSSSSFVLICTEDHVKNVIKDLDDLQKKIIRNCFKKREILGRKMLMITGWSDMGGNYWYDSVGGLETTEEENLIIEKDQEEDPSKYYIGDIWYRIKDTLCVDSENSFYEYIDM